MCVEVHKNSNSEALEYRAFLFRTPETILAYDICPKLRATVLLTRTACGASR